ncbi:polysaccharide deacetylase family protein [Kitasatospora sp. NBC_00315]|uniref:polysaccharide deacetylase family protein n=1 Tax=Kitasatospora sp. NBC_00315 TaxID=2975963 RepID=UPI00324BDAED
MPSSRRTLLAALAGGALTGCRPGPDRSPAGTRSGPPNPDRTGAQPPGASPAATAASPSGDAVPPPAGVTREEVVARYGAAEPTGWGFDAPGVISRLSPTATDAGAIALTFDACGGPQGSGYDEALTGFLREHRVPATLFLNSRWIEANPSVFRQLAADPLFEIANHGTRHCPLSVSGRSAYGIDGTRDAGEVFDEIAGNRAGLTRLLGRPPRFFRSGTAYLDDVAARIVDDLGERFAGFTVNGDGGATFSAEQVRREVGAAGPGAIVLAHMNQPGGGTAAGIAAAVPELLDAGRHFVRLSDGVG